MKNKVNYKEECLKINSKFRVNKVETYDGTKHHIIVGNKNNHANYSLFCDTPALAWEYCYNKLKTIENDEK